MDYAHWGLIGGQGELFELGDNVGGHGAGFVYGDVDKHMWAHGDGVENVVLVLQGYPKVFHRLFGLQGAGDAGFEVVDGDDAVGEGVKIGVVAFVFHQFACCAVHKGGVGYAFNVHEDAVHQSVEITHEFLLFCFKMG